MQLQPVTVDQTYPNGKEEEKKTKLFSMVVVMALLGLRRHFNWLPPYRSGIRETVAKFIAGSWKSRPEAYGNLKSKQQRRKNSHRWPAYVAVYQSISQWASQASQLAGPWEKQSNQQAKPPAKLPPARHVKYCFWFNWVLWEMMMGFGFQVGLA